jgi:hypothetical protein
MTTTYVVKICLCVRFQVLTAASMMFRVVFWDVLPCKMIVDRRFKGAYCLHHQGSLMMEAVRTSAAAWLLWSRVPIPLRAWMFVSCVGRGLCVGPITRPEKSYRVCIIVGYQETLVTEKNLRSEEIPKKHSTDGG